METSDVIGIAGVSLLLVAFFLNLFGIIEKEAKIYIVLNFVGAAIACYASVLIHFMPFVILEGTWSLVALFSLVRPYIKKV
jgi:hypothetical protein